VPDVARFGRAFVGGVIGAAAMSALTALARLRGVSVDFESMLGTMAGGAPTPGRRRAGLALQLINGGLLAQPYAAILDRAPHAPGWVLGAALGLVHSVAAGGFLAAVPAVHPEIPRRLPEPGPFYARRGTAAVALLVVIHLVYGAIVGAVYAAVPRRTVRAWGR
jgi:hypothetical protein